MLANNSAVFTLFGKHLHNIFTLSTVTVTLSNIKIPLTHFTFFEHSLRSMRKDTAISFAGGGMYGLVTVAVGQPLDTVKTRMQARPENLRSSMGKTGMELFKKEGIPGLYRGGMPLVIGGVFLRSAQFGFYKATMQGLGADRADYVKPTKLLGVVDPHVMLAGFFGGLGRGLVEGPAEYIKVRTQVVKNWSFLKM